MGQVDSFNALVDKMVLDVMANPSLNVKFYVWLMIIYAV